MGLDITISVMNREKAEKNAELNAQIDKRNEAAWEKEGDNAVYERTLDDHITNSYYFRKVNCLMGWVERNVQEFDNCEDVELSKDDIELLHETVMDLTPENCEEDMPTEDGFFYGSQEYDEYYWDGIEDIRKMTTELLDETNWDEEMVVFSAWW